MAHGAIKTASGVLAFVGSPGSPSNLVATANGQNRIDLTWLLSTARPREKGVRVEWGTDGVDFPSTADLPAGTTLYSASDLTPGTKYYFRVVALGNVIQSVPSNVDDATTASADAPVASFTPERTTVVAGSSIIFTNTSTGDYSSSSWKVNSVEVSTADSPSILFDTAGTFSVTLTVTGPGGSDTSDPTIISVTPVSTPNLLSATVSPNGTRWALTFDATVTGHSGFVFRNGANAVLSASYVSGEGTTSLLFDADVVYDGDTPHLDYTPGNVAHSAIPLAAFTGFEVDNQSDQTLPVGDSPVLNSAGATGDVLTITFAAAVGGYANVDPAFLNDFGEHGFTLTSAAGGLLIEEYLAGDGTTSITFQLNRTPTAGETLTLGYVPGLLVASSGGAPLRPFAGRSVTNNNGGVSDPATPGIPTAVSGVAGDDWTVILGCTLADSRDTQVQWRRSASGAGVWTTVATLAGRTAAINDEGPLSPSTAYDYQVRAGNVSGWSDWSATATVTTLAGSASGGLSISATLTATTTSDSTIRLNWTTPVGANGLLHVYRATAGAFTRVKCVDLLPGAQNWTDAGLSPGVTYTYRATLVTPAATYGAWSEVSATTSSTVGVPLVPADLSHFVVSETQTIVMVRDTNGGAASYLVETAPVPGPGTPDTAVWTQVGVIPVGDTAFTLTTTAKQTRYVRVRADLDGVQSGYTAFDLNRTVVRPPSGASGTLSVTPATFASLASQILTAKRVEFADGTYPLKPFFVGRGRASDPVVYTKASGATSVVFDMLDATTPSVFDAPSGYIYQDFLGGFVGKLVSDPNGYQPGHLRITDITFRRASRDNSQATIVSKSLTGNVATITLSAPHNIPAGSLVDVRLSPADTTFDGGKTVTAVTSTTLSYTKSHADVAETATDGTLRYGLYTADDGTNRGYSTAASGLYIQSGDHVVIDGCTLADNGNGLFGANNGTDLRDVARIVVRGNTFSGNGTYQSDRQHTSYMECRGVVYEANDYLPNRAGASGASLKDRSTDVTIRCNNMAGSTVRYHDLVECQNQQGRALADPAWGRVLAWGNRMLNAVVGAATGASTPINWGQDDGQDKNGRRHLLSFYHNTLANFFESGQKFRIVWFKTAAKPEAVYVVNNIFSTASPTGGTKPEPDLFSTTNGVGVFGGNFLSTGYKQQSTSSADTALAYGIVGSISPSDNEVDYIDAANGDVRVLQGTAAAGVGVDLPLDWPRPKKQYVRVGVMEDRTNYGAGGDLGYTDAAPDTTAPTVSGTVTVNALGNQLTVPLSEACVGSTGFVLTVNASPVSLTKNAGASTSTSFVYDIAAVVLTGQTCLLAKSGGDITDTAGNAVADFSGRSVTNGSLIASAGVPVIASINTGTQASSTTFTLTSPSGTAAGDLLVAIEDNASAGGTGTTTEPAGHWTKVTETVDSPTGAVRLITWRRIADGTSADNLSLQSTAAKTWAGGILRVTGADTSDPIADSQTSVSTANATTITCPDATAVDDSLVLRVVAAVSVIGVVPSGNIELWRLGGTGASAANGAAAKGQASAGATGTAAFTFSTVGRGAAVTLVIRPVP